MSTGTRVWKRRSTPGRRLAAGTLTWRRRRSFPLRVVMRSRDAIGFSPYRRRSQDHYGPITVGASPHLFDLDRSQADAIRAVVGALGDLQALAFAAGPEAHVHGVGAGWRRHQRHVDVIVVAHVLARQPVVGGEGLVQRIVIAQQARRRRAVKVNEYLVAARRVALHAEGQLQPDLPGTAHRRWEVVTPQLDCVAERGEPLH